MAVVALGWTGLAFVGLRWWSDQGNRLPGASWAAAVLVVFMAAGVYAAGLPVRRFLRGHARTPMNPLRAMRTVVLAQAAALTGALVTGWYAAQALVLLPNLDVATVRSAALEAAALAAAGGVLTAAGLRAQAMCRLPDDHDPPG
ncbi:MAG TPA: DUF3180 domain-containing protein [Dermatophilaceae bacterium]|nr:DUF3180 domain-containing protein [Dermatophilaceae bacterium]